MGYYYRNALERLPIRDGVRSIYLVARPERLLDGETLEQATRRLVLAVAPDLADQLHWMPSNMGVPISYMDKHCPEQFEILDVTDGTSPLRIKTYDHPVQVNPDGTECNGSKINTGSAIEVEGPAPGRATYRVGDRHYRLTYQRVLIRRRPVVRCFCTLCCFRPLLPPAPRDVALRCIAARKRQQQQKKK